MSITSSLYFQEDLFLYIFKFNSSLLNNLNINAIGVNTKKNITPNMIGLIIDPMIKPNLIHNILKGKRIELFVIETTTIHTLNVIIIVAKTK